MTIESYVVAVGQHLGHPRARQGLDDLRQALRELADEVGDEQACREFGDPADYAAKLDAEFGQGDDAPDQRRIFGIPVNFRIAEGWWTRVFDPSNPRVLVPRLFGIGWTINFGALAVKFGGLHPDDVAEDTIAQLDVHPAAYALVGMVGAAAVAVAAAGVQRDGEFPTHWGANGKPNRWGSWSRAVASPIALGAGAVAVAAIPTATGRPCVDRLAAQALGCVVLGAGLGQAAMATTGRDGRRMGPAAMLGPLVGVAAGVVTLVVPFRAAVRRAAAIQNRARKEK